MSYEENQFPQLGSPTDGCFSSFDRCQGTCCGVTLGNHFNRRRSIGCILLLEKVRKNYLTGRPTMSNECKNYHIMVPKKWAGLI